MKKAMTNRDLILSLFQENHLLTANDIVLKLSKNMDRATVYRNLNKLAGDGTLRELHLEKGIITYELASDEHQHFFCKNCDKVLSVDIDASKLSKLINSSEFEANEIELNISGICKDCK